MLCQTLDKESAEDTQKENIFFLTDVSSCFFLEASDLAALRIKHEELLIATAEVVNLFTLTAQTLSLFSPQKPAESSDCPKVNTSTVRT